MIGSKKYCLVIILMLSIFVISGCQKEIVKEKLVFRITWEKHSGRGEIIKSIVDDFNEQSKTYYVEMIGGNENREDLINTLSKDQSDIYMMPYRYIQDAKISNELLTLVDYNEEDLSYYYPSMIELAKYKNELKGIPWIGHSMSLIYNKDLCDKAGVNPEMWTTIDDLVDGCNKIVEKTDAKALGLVGANAHDITWMVNQFIYSFGGSLVEFNEEGEFEHIAIQSVETEKALDFYKNTLGPMAQENWKVDTGREVLEAFSDQKIAFEIQGPWGVTDIWKKGNEFEVGTISLNQIGMYSEVGPIMLSVSNDAKDTVGAMEFVEYLNSEKSLEVILRGEYEPKYDAYFPFRIPIKKDSLDSEFYKLYPEFLAFSEGFKRPSVSTPCPEWSATEEKYTEVLHKIMTDKITIKDALEEGLR